MKLQHRICAGILLALFLFCLVGCGAQSASQSSAAKPGPVQSGNVLSGTLTVCIEEQYCHDEWPIWNVLQAFEAANPGLTVKYEAILSAYDYGLKEDRVLAREAQISQIEADIMAGGGPDIFLLDTSCTGPYQHLFGDLNKLLRSGIFCDVAPYLVTPLPENDVYGAVLQAGCRENEQLVMPLSFSLPLLLSERAWLDKAGFDRAAAATNLSAFEQEITRVMAANPNLSARAVWDYIYCLKTPMMDYDAKTVHLGEQVFRDAFAARQSLGAAPWNLLTQDLQNSAQDVQRIHEGTQLFSGQDMSIFLIESAQQLQALGGAPEFLGVPSEDGGYTAVVKSYAAIRATSKNKSAAGVLLTTLLTAGAQSKNAFCGGTINFPVRKSSLAQSLELNRLWALENEQLTNAEPLSNSTMQSLTNILDGISTTHLQFYYGDAIRLGDKTLMEYFLPYEKEQTDYDTLLAAVEPKLLLYLQE